MSPYNIGKFDPRAEYGHEERLEKYQRYLDMYKSVGLRNTYLFKWLLKMCENVTLSCTDPEFYEKLVMDKAKLCIIDVLIDDTADNEKIRDKKFFEEMSHIPFDQERIRIGRLSEYQKNYLDVTKTIWDDFYKNIQEYPRYEEFKDLFEFDVRQIINSIRHGYLINSVPNAANSLENRIYGHHAMIVIVSGTMDLMCSSSFDSSELRYLRKALYISQVMARFGNMISTYKREIGENDITSEVFTLGIEQGKISINDLDNGRVEGKVRSLFSEFSREWENYLNELRKILKGIKSIDTDNFIRQRYFIKESYDRRVEYWRSQFSD